MSRAYPSIALVLCAFCACSEREGRAPPPLPSIPSALPVVPSEQPVAPTASGQAPTPGGGRDAHAQKSSKRVAESERKSTSQRKPSAPEPASAAKAASVAPARAASVAPAPAPQPAATPAEKIASRVKVPSTAHVHAELPSGLQRDLDADPRMQSWLDRAFAIIDGCHAQNRGAAGTIEAQLTMHEEARPDADIRALPPALSGVVACATGGLMRTKMPLFTGAEGTRYTVRIRFD